MRSIGEGYNHICMVIFAPHRGAILAVQGHVKNAGPELLGHLGLQLQAFDHPRFDTAVMVANRQYACRALGA